MKMGEENGVTKKLQVEIISVENVKLVVPAPDHLSKENGVTKKLQVEIISVENVKPAVPAPDYLSNSKENGVAKKLQVEIISVENVKPAVPAPDHLRYYKVSFLDQIHQKCYMSSINFYQNGVTCSKVDPIIQEDLSLKRRQLLKKSLSETLTLFYPLAGKVYDDYIDCNNEGIYYVEAKTNEQLSDFLKQPHYKSMHELLPFIPSSKELLSQKYVTMVQVTVFSCGGIAIGLYTSHKIIDGYSEGIFMKAWAATARGVPESVYPNFTLASSIFPPNPNRAKEMEAIEDIHPFYSQKAKTITRRVVFTNSALVELKSKALASSRVIAVTCLIWKCAMAAKLKLALDSSTPKSYTLALMMDLRSRIRPPLPHYTIGNIIWSALSKFEANEGIGELSSLVGLLKNAIRKIDSDFVETMKGEDGFRRVGEYLDEMKDFFGGNYNDSMSVTSMCNGGIYETDFGWGKPIWIGIGDADADVPMVENLVYLLDTSSGGGIEAWVTFTKDEMDIFESDAELLAFASLDTSPLQMVD